jgi:hypothetical protein
VRDPAGNFTLFDVPGATDTRPQSINAGGAVTGFYYTQQSTPAHGFLRDADGTITLFDPPGSTQSGTFPVTINNAGAIAGYYQNASFHGFVRDPSGNITSFDPPGSTGTYPASINYSGAITGYFFTGDRVRSYGFVRDAAGTITSFDPGTYTLPASINSHGAIAGRYSTYFPVINPSGFLRSPGGTITLLDPPSLCPRYISPTSINEGGVITGGCGATGSTQVGFVGFPAKPAGPEFAYVANYGSANVSAYTIDPTTGALTAISGSPFAAGTNPFSVAWTPQASSSMWRFSSGYPSTRLTLPRVR